MVNKTAVLFSFGVFILEGDTGKKHDNFRHRKI